MGLYFLKLINWSYFSKGYIISLCRCNFETYFTELLRNDKSEICYNRFWNINSNVEHSNSTYFKILQAIDNFIRWLIRSNLLLTIDWQLFFFDMEVNITLEWKLSRAAWSRRQHLNLNTTCRSSSQVRWFFIAAEKLFS